MWEAFFVSQEYNEGVWTVNFNIINSDNGKIKPKSFEMKEVNVESIKARLAEICNRLNTPKPAEPEGFVVGKVDLTPSGASTLTPEQIFRNDIIQKRVMLSRLLNDKAEGLDMPKMNATITALQAEINALTNRQKNDIFGYKD
jgi:hypothetical protein